MMWHRLPTHWHSSSKGGIIPSWQGGFTDDTSVQDYDKEYRFETVRNILKPFFQTGNASQKFKQALFNAIDHPGSKGGDRRKQKHLCKHERYEAMDWNAHGIYSLASMVS
jgi:hypothetical protein